MAELKTNQPTNHGAYNRLKKVQKSPLEGVVEHTKPELKHKTSRKNRKFPLRDPSAPHEADIMQEITSHPIKPVHCCYCWKYWVNFSANNSLVSHLTPCVPEANTWYQVNFISNTVCLILHGGSHATIPLKMMWIHSLHRLESKDLLIALRVLPMLPFSLLYSHKWHCSYQ